MSALEGRLGSGLLAALLLAFACGKSGQVHRTASGLSYEILTPGQPGPSPGPNDLVVVHYTGKLETGEEIDTTRGHMPAQFRIGERGIAGLNEGLQLMTRGARYRFTVPPELGHGAEGHDLVPPNATLYFEVELLDFQPGPKPPSFRPGNPAKQQKTDSGLVYEVLLEGEGEPITEYTNLVMQFACWNREGKLLHWSGASEPYRGNSSGFNLPFMREAVCLMKQGALYRFEVPPEMGFAEEGLTVWEIQIANATPPTEAELRAPAFSRPPPESLTRTESGLLYRVVQAGSGPLPSSDSRLVLHFAGWLEDGTQVDSTYLRESPVTLRLHEVFPGFREGLRLMQAGSIYEFIFPPELAFGMEGKLPRIPASSTLIFRVELLAIEAQDA